MFFNPIAYFVAASAVALLVGAALFRKRVSLLLIAIVNYHTETNQTVEWLTFSYILPLPFWQKSEAEEPSELSGAVSKRRGLIASGDEVPDISTVQSSQPKFIEMQTLERSPTTVSHAGEGIEVEGPIFPSSYIAMT
jgi:hypothetical protein